MKRNASASVTPYGAFRLLASPFQKFRGLLGSARTASPVVLVPCSAIHTFGMRYPIDAAAADAGGSVLGVVLGLPPGRQWRVPGAFAVFERPASSDPWFSAGEQLEIVLSESKDKE